MAPQGHSSSMPTTPSKRSKTTSPQSTPTKSCLKPDSSDLIFVLDLGRKEVKFDLSGNEEHEADIYDRTPILVDEVPQEEMLVLLANRNGIDTTKENWADLCACIFIYWTVYDAYIRMLSHSTYAD